MKFVPWIVAVVVLVAPNARRRETCEVHARIATRPHPSPIIARPVPVPTSEPRVPRVPLQPGERRDEATWRMLTEELQYARREAERIYKDLMALEDAHIALARRKKQLEEVISGLTLVNGIAETSPPPKALEGRVTSVDGGVILSIGTSDGVANGGEFTIYREAAFVAKIVINHVATSWCSGRVTLMKDGPRVGDDASNNVFVTSPMK